MKRVNPQQRVIADPKELKNLTYDEMMQVNKPYCYKCLKNMGFTAKQGMHTAQRVKCHCCKQHKLCKPLRHWSKAI